jgi:hypothetical protein
MKEGMHLPNPSCCHSCSEDSQHYFLPCQESLQEAFITCDFPVPIFCQTLESLLPPSRTPLIDPTAIPDLVNSFCCDGIAPTMQRAGLSPLAPLRENRGFPRKQGLLHRISSLHPLRDGEVPEEENLPAPFCEQTTSGMPAFTPLNNVIVPCE